LKRPENDYGINDSFKHSGRTIMRRNSLFLTLIAFLVVLTIASAVRAWGGYHVGYTHYSPYTGLHHYGYTGVYRGGYGYGGYHYGGAYGYHYGYGGYGGYHYGGYHYGGYGYGGARYGYHRAW
jgi:hypothetical protein